jgi:hypothetical protein
MMGHGYVVENRGLGLGVRRSHGGDLVRSIGGGYPTLPVHAYIPIQEIGVTVMRFVEDEPVAYRNQMRAKHVTDAARKRWRRTNPDTHSVFRVIGITVK